MRTILLTALCAITIGTQAKVANDTIDKYIIDKQPIEHFDGSQLEGKRISKYMIAYKQGKGVVEKHHVIYTGDEAGKTFTIEGNANGPIVVSKMLGPLIIVDGKESSNEEMALIKSEDVASVYVFEPGSEVAKSYGEKGSKGVIKVTTKSANVTIVSDPLVIVDGKEISKKELEKINPNDITHMEVIKNGSKAAEQWGSKGLNGVIIVTTKAGKKDK
jgi:aspartate 1-decarboxylase